MDIINQASLNNKLKTYWDMFRLVDEELCKLLGIEGPITKQEQDLIDQRNAIAFSMNDIIDKLYDQSMHKFHKQNIVKDGERYVDFFLRDVVNQEETANKISILHYMRFIQKKIDKVI